MLGLPFSEEKEGYTGGRKGEREGVGNASTSAFQKGYIFFFFLILILKEIKINTFVQSGYDNTYL